MPSQLEFEGDSDDVIELAVQEMGQRMSDPDRRSGVPDHVLIKFLAEANKSADRRQAAKERERQENSQRDEIEVVLNSQLPSERKRVLLEEALRKLEERVRALKELLQRGDI